MVDVRLVGLCFSLITLLLGCATQPVQQQTFSRDATYTSPVQTVNRNMQVPNSNSEQLDNVIREGFNYISNRIHANSKIGVVNMQSSSINLSNYVIDSTVMHLVNTDRFVVIERADLNSIQREHQYQISGEVSDATAISVGQQLGVQFIVTGSIMPLGDNYSLRLKITDIQSAQIMGTRIFTVRPDNVLLSLINSPANREEVVSQPREEQRRETPQQVFMGDVNITNNTTTTIHGDVYVNMPRDFGW